MAVVHPCPALLSPHFLDLVNRRMIASAPSVVDLVYLVHLVCLVGLVQPNKQDKPNKRDKPDNLVENEDVFCISSVRLKTGVLR